MLLLSAGDVCVLTPSPMLGMCVRLLPHFAKAGVSRMLGRCCASAVPEMVPASLSGRTPIEGSWGWWRRGEIRGSEAAGLALFLVVSGAFVYLWDSV